MEGPFECSEYFALLSTVYNSVNEINALEKFMIRVLTDKPYGSL